MSSLLAVGALERLHALTIVSGGLFSLLGDEDEPDAQQRIVGGLASLHLTRLELVSTALLPAFPATLRHLLIEDTGKLGEDVMTRVGELTRLTHLELRQCGVVDGLGAVSSLVNLEFFGFADNPRQSLAPLAPLTRITSLDLAGMYVDDDDSGVSIPDGVHGLDALRVLNLSFIRNLMGWPALKQSMPDHTTFHTHGTTFA